MRRAVSILLLLIFSSMLMAPSFAAGPEANLPPCCRTHGKHHCMMQGTHHSDGRPGFTAAHEKCPRFPAGTVASHSLQSVPAASYPLPVFVLTADRVPPQTETGLTPAFFAACPQRGPPSPLA